MSLLSPKTTQYLICHLLYFDVFWGGIWYESVFLSTLKDTRICSQFLLTLVYLSFFYLIFMPSIYFANGSTDNKFSSK